MVPLHVAGRQVVIACGGQAGGPVAARAGYCYTLPSSMGGCKPRPPAAAHVEQQGSSASMCGLLALLPVVRMALAPRRSPLAALQLHASTRESCARRAQERPGEVEEPQHVNAATSMTGANSREKTIE